MSLFDDAGFDVVVIAASLGGPQVLQQLVSALPVDFPAPILVVQHLSAGAPSSMAELLESRSRLRIEWAMDGARLRARTVYLAYPGRHLTVTGEGALKVTNGPRVSFALPAADLLFSSAAASFGPRALGVVLTGRLHDGAAGSEAIHKAGGVVLVQDPRTCRDAGMPGAVIRKGACDFVLPPEAIASALVSLVMVPGARTLFAVG